MPCWSSKSQTPTHSPTTPSDWASESAPIPQTNIFLSTHNPYLLVPILEKTPKDEMALFATRYQNYETTVVPLTEDRIGRLLDADPFLRLQTVLETE